MGLWGESIFEEPRACAQRLLLSTLLSCQLYKLKSAFKQKLNYYSLSIIDWCQRRQCSFTAAISLNSVPMVATVRLGCCDSATNAGMWRPGSNPGKAKPNCGSSTCLSGERWWTQVKEHGYLPYKTKKGLWKRSFHRFTQSRSGLFVHSWGYS